MKTFFEKLLITIVIVVPGLVFGFMGKPAEMGIAIAAGAIVAAFINIDKIQKFKGAGFEAEMVIRKAVDEAYATIENLRDLAAPLIISVIDTITHAGRWGGMDTHQKHESKEKLSEIANLLKLNNPGISESINTFHRYHTWDLYLNLKAAVTQYASVSAEIRQKLDELIDRKSEDYPSKETILNIIGDFSPGANFNEAMVDYEFYLKNKSLRRKETLSIE